MQNRRVARWHWPVLAVWLGTTCTTAATQPDQTCQVRFTQNGATLEPVQAGRWEILRVAKAPFEISVKPASCRPVIAALTSLASISEVASLTDVVFTGSGHGYAATEDMSDILYWASREPITTKLEEMSSEWAFIDTYRAESGRLGYKPQPVLAWGSGWPFRPDEGGSRAAFRRLTENIPLAPNMPDVNLPVVIYLTVKELMKPTWHNAQAPWSLSRPYRVVLSFNQVLP